MTTKSNLIDNISEQTDFTKKNSKKTVNTFLEAIEEYLQSGGNLQLTGFGSFKVEHRKEREGRNPQNGEKITIPANKFVKLNPGKALKEKEVEYLI